MTNRGVVIWSILAVWLSINGLFLYLDFGYTMYVNTIGTVLYLLMLLGEYTIDDFGDWLEKPWKKK